jgi:hypothetical protein
MSSVVMPARGRNGNLIKLASQQASKNYAANVASPRFGSDRPIIEQPFASAKRPIT